MGKTIVEKILGKWNLRGKHDVVPGDFVEVTHGGLKLNFGCDLSMGRYDEWEELGWPEVYNPESFVLVAGHVGISNSPPRTRDLFTTTVVNNNKKWALNVGVPHENILDIGRAGVEHHVSIDNAWAIPGTVHLSIVNGHAYTHGAVGAWAMSLSGAGTAYLITGKVWFRVPESVKINISGSLPQGVMARDVIEHIIGTIGETGSKDMAAEFTGPTIDAMTMDSRFTIVNGTPWIGAMAGICNPDTTTINYVKERQPEAKFTPLVSDPDAVYAKTYEFDVSNIEPQVACHPDRYGVKPISEVKGRKINRGYIGSCASARIEHLRMAAKVLDGNKVHRSVQLTISPATVPTYREAVKEGLIGIFLDAEAAIAQPACGMCNGGYSPLADGDICMSTSTVNGVGRMGSRNSQINLASAATVAASCIEGKMADPREYI